MSVKSLKTGTRSISMLAGNTPEHHVLIAETTVGSGGAASVTFSNIPADYQHLQIRIIGRSTANASEDNLKMQFNNDTGSNYYYHQLLGNGSAASSGNSGAAAFIQPWALPGATFLSNSFGVIVVDILDYVATKNRVTRALGGYDDNSTGGRIALTSGLWNNTAAVTSIRFTTGANIAQYSTFQLYGVK